MTPLNSTTVSEPNVTANRVKLSLSQRMALGSLLVELREARGLSQLEVARQALGFTVSHAAVSRLERGILAGVDFERLERIAEFFDTSAQTLLSEIVARREAEVPQAYLPCDELQVSGNVGGRIQQLRHATDLSRDAFARQMGYESCQSTVVRMWETGEAVPNPDTLLKMAIAFSVSAAWLITGKRAKPLTPTMGMRLRALQKLHGLTNQEVAHLAGLDALSGRAYIANLSRKAQVSARSPKLQAIAEALDVPVQWLVPNPQWDTPSFDMKAARASTGVASLSKSSSAALPEGLSPRMERCLLELAEMLTLGSLDEEDLKDFHAQSMKKAMRQLMSKPLAVAQAA